MLSGLLHHLQRSVQTLRKTVVRIAGPSCVEKCWMFRTMPFGAEVFTGEFSIVSPQFPREMPRDRAIWTNTLLSGTVRTLLMASAMGTDFRSGGWEATMTPL